MKKIRLTENDLHRIVKNSVKRILMEQEDTFKLSEEDLGEIEYAIEKLIENGGSEYSFEDDIDFEGKDYSVHIYGYYSLGSFHYKFPSDIGIFNLYEPSDLEPSSHVDIEIWFDEGTYSKKPNPKDEERINEYLEFLVDNMRNA